MSGYIGNIPVPAATQTRDTFTATASQTTFATSGYTPSFLDVFMNGVHLVNGTDYTATNGSDVVLTSGAAAGDVLEVVAYSTFEPADVTASSGFTVTGNLSVDGGTIKLDGNYPVGTNNVALGDAALDSNVSGASNTAIGADALTANTASNNTAVGYQAGYSQQTGIDTVAVGYRSLYNGTGLRNTAIGKEALFSLTTGTNNTAIGESAGYSLTTGSKNVILGTYSGNQGGLDIRTSSNNIVLSDGDGNPRLHINSVGVTTATTYTESANSVRTVRSIRASSNFSNPTVTLLTITDNGPIYANLAVKVIVRQHPWSNTGFPNQHEGFATSNNAGSSRYVTSMSVTQSATSSVGNVGTLSWSGNSLQYTANRASNYDQYYIDIEISSSAVSYTT